VTTQSHPEVRGPRDVDDAIAMLRLAGGRCTRGKLALIELFFATDGLLSSHEVAASLPELDVSTVYRGLAQLEEAGIVEHVHLAHGAAEYRRVGAGSAIVTCDACGATFQVPRALFDRLNAELDDGYGIRLHLGHFALGGRCRECR
jgi:Fur family transcriptional regulator, ferric uptake regulator